MRWLSTFAVGFALWSFMLAEACAEKRIALVIGNGAYKHANWVLPNPPHDAEDVAGALKRVGFETILATDLDQAAMQEATIRFARAARGADVAIFYYSGHAMQYGGVNYLVPVDGDLRDEADLRRMARVDQILADLQQAKNLRILVLDSCRNNPIAEQLKRFIGLTRSATIGVGLAKMESPDGTIISFATQAGQEAEDGTGQRNSPYTKAFLNHIEEKEEIATVFRRISADVRETTNRTQIPELSLSFFGEFYLNGKLQITVTPPPPSAPADPCAAAGDHWRSAEAIGSFAAFEDHLARFPNCIFAGLARVRIDNLKNKQAAVVPEVLPAASKAPQVVVAPGKDTDPAIADYTRAIQLNPKSALPYVNRGLAYRLKNDYDKALADYTEAIQVDPKYAIAYNGRGTIYFNKKEYDNAIADYSEAIRIDPMYAVAYQNRGSAYRSIKDYDRAIADTNKAIQINPVPTVLPGTGHLNAFNLRGNVYFDKVDYDHAIQDYTEAIRVDPTYAMAYRNRGNAYFREKKYDQAIPDFNTAIRLDPMFAQAHKDLGDVYRIKENYDRAIAEYGEAIQLNPKYSDAYNGRGNVYYAKKDYDRAIADYDEAIRLSPENATFINNRGSALRDKAATATAPRPKPQKPEGREREPRRL